MSVYVSNTFIISWMNILKKFAMTQVFWTSKSVIHLHNIFISTNMAKYGKCKSVKEEIRMFEIL